MTKKVSRARRAPRRKKPSRAGPRGGTAGLPRRPPWPWPRKPPRRFPISRSAFARFLVKNPWLARAIVWRAPGPAEEVTGVPTPYSQWNSDQKRQLADAWSRIRAGRIPGLPAAPSVGLNLNNAGELFSTLLTPSVAWSYFIGYVAQSLAAEADKTFPWSLNEYNPEQLVWLLDSKSLFHYSSSWGRYGSVNIHGILESLGAAQPGDPVRTFEFLWTRGLIGASRTDTIEHLLEWCRANLVHYYGSWTPANMREYWKYRGWAPVERILSGTRHRQFGFAHWTAGCWGTAGFLRAVLRTVNIPVSIENRDGHALPRFQIRTGNRRSSDLYLSHGDDPYNWGWRATPPVPIGELPFSAKTFARWFGPNAVLPPGGSNVGRQTVELAIRHLSNPLLRWHCEDLAAGRGPAQSKVYDPNVSGLGRFFTLGELQAQGLWNRLNARIVAIGGCANVPP